MSGPALVGLRLPVRTNEKRTYIEDWSNPYLTQPEIKSGENVALRLEKMTDLDLDCPQAIAAAAKFIGNTYAFGRSGRAASHYFFGTVGLAYTIFKDIDETPLLELRHGFGHYTVIPPSRIPRKGDGVVEELIETCSAAPRADDPADLLRLARMIATIALVVRHWPRGGRHNGLNHLAGFLGRAGLPDWAARQVLEEITVQAEGEVWRDCDSAVRDAYRKLKADDKVTGAPELAKWIGQGVVDRLREWYGKRDSTKKDEQPLRELKLVTADTIQVKATKWLWQDRMPIGSLGLLAGREGIGKSTVAYTLIADVTRGRLDGVHRGQPRSVIICATEDSWEHTINPRLLAAGADLTKVHRVEVAVDEITTDLLLPADIPALGELIRERGDIAVLLLDPITSRLSSKLDTHKDAEVRRALEPTREVWKANSSLDQFCADADISRPETPRRQAAAIRGSVPVGVLLGGYFSGGQPEAVASDLVRAVRAAVDATRVAAIS